jgi:hypothetical protein
MGNLCRSPGNGTGVSCHYAKNITTLCILPDQLDEEKLEILLETIAGVEV